MLESGKFLDLSHTNACSLFQGDSVYPWHALERLQQFFSDLRLGSEMFTKVGNPQIVGNVVIGEGSVIEDGAMILGPALIGRFCHIRHGAYIRDHTIVGDGCTVGNACEVKASILFNECQVAHFNYVGDSVLGYRAHLGAGVKLSNVKLVPGEIVVRAGDEVVHTGMEKLGSIIGDNAQIGCNAVLNPGSVIGRNSIIYPNTTWSGYLPENSVAKQSAHLQIRPFHLQNKQTI